MNRTRRRQWAKASGGGSVEAEKRPDVPGARTASDRAAAWRGGQGHEPRAGLVVLLVLVWALHACNGTGGASSPADRAGSASPTLTSAPQWSTATATPTSLPSPTPSRTPGLGDVVEGPALLTFIEQGPDSGKFVLTDLNTGTSRFVGGLFTWCAGALTREFLYEITCGTPNQIVQLVPETREVVRRAPLPVYTKNAVVASPDDRFLFVASQDCPGNAMCWIPSRISVYRIPDLRPDWAAEFIVPGSVCRMFFLGDTLLVVSAPAPREQIPPGADPTETFVITLVRVTGDGPWNRVQRIVRGSLSSLHVGGLGPIDATGTCRGCCWW